MRRTHFPLDLTTLVPADMLKQYAGADNCTFNGKVYCLRNDLAQMVTYYNAPLFTKFGYEVPKTFEDMQALSDKVAKDHPGYYLGTLGDGWTWLSYFEASGCPYANVKDVGTLQINVSDPNCTRAAQLIDHMVANKTLWNTDYFTASWVTIANNNKLLMLIAPIWAALGTFKGTYYTDKTTPSQTSHVLGVAAPLKWAADATAQTAAMGGAAWTISQHTKNQGLVAALRRVCDPGPGPLEGLFQLPVLHPAPAVVQRDGKGRPDLRKRPHGRLRDGRGADLRHWRQLAALRPDCTAQHRRQGHVQQEADDGGDVAGGPHGPQATRGGSGLQRNPVGLAPQATTGFIDPSV